MFTNIVSETVFSSSVADRIFERVQCNDFRGDVVFKSTLRALLFPRMKEEERVDVKLFSNTASGVASDTATGTLSNILSVGSTPIEESLRIISLSGNEETLADVFEQIDVAANELLPGFLEADKIRKCFAYMHQGCDLANPAVRCRLYLNESDRRGIMIMGGMDMSRYRVLNMTIHLAFPWYFQDAPLTDEEKALLSATNPANGSQDDYAEILNRMADKYDLRTEAIKAQLGDFEQRYCKMQVEQIQYNIENVESEIRRLYDGITAKTKNLFDLKARQSGYMLNAEQSNDQGVMNYFLNNKSIFLIDSDGNSVTFAIRGYVMMWDEDAFDRVWHNTDSYLYENAGDLEGAKMLFDAVFNRQIIKLKICAMYRLEMFGAGEAISHAKYPPECDGYMPNPHAHYYSCLGGHEMAIKDALRNFDYVGAIDQCGAHARNLNFSDSTVMRKFSEQIFERGSGKWFELPDGTCVTANAAIKWLQKQEEEAN